MADTLVYVIAIPLAADEEPKAVAEMLSLFLDGAEKHVANYRLGEASCPPHPELRHATAEAIGREGMATVWDDQGRYLGCMGVETWRRALEADAERQFDLASVPSLVGAVQDLIAGAEGTGKSESDLRWAVRRAYHAVTKTTDPDSVVAP